MSFFVARSVFLKLLGVIYLIAFLSLSKQVEGLVGAEGILPVGGFLERAYSHLDSDAYFRIPTLSWFFTGDLALRWFCVLGIIFSLLLIVGIAPVPMLSSLWILYLSLTNSSQIFLSFQWDILLLETGFLAIFLAPLHLFPNKRKITIPSKLVLFLFWWLIFRLLFASGLVKWLADPVWRDFTALSYHYETQPLPTWIGWFAHQLPMEFQKFSCFLMFVIEIGVPFLIFLPGRFKKIACWIFISFQSLIILTGNYSFFNLLAIALSLLLLENRFWPEILKRKIIPKDVEEDLREPRRWPFFIVLPVFLLLLCYSAFVFTGQFYPAKSGISPPFKNWIYKIQGFHIANRYGLFANMTTSRPEIIIEGSLDGQNWKEYEFKWKPGDLKRRPRFVAPHQPRLDWQMWFAALGNFENQPWLARFMGALLKGNPKVLNLLERNPFPDHPPKYIRALTYDYHFTDIQRKSGTGEWWHRELTGPYSPVLSLR